MLPKDIIYEISYYCDFLVKHRLKLLNKISYQTMGITYIPRKYKYQLNDGILKKYSELKFLNVLCHRNITDEGIKHMNLHTLYASTNCGITDEGIKHMNLHVLDVYHNEKITDEGIKYMNLYALNASWNKKITDEGIKQMNLHTLYAAGPNCLRKSLTV